MIYFHFQELSAHREQLQPDLLKAFDDIFEMELPLEIAQVDSNSEVSFMQEK